MNAIKTHYIVITKKRILPVLELILNGSIVQRETFIEFLDVYVDDKLTWHEHIRHRKFKLASSLFAINMAKRCLTPQLMLTLYNSLVYPYLTYNLLLWGSAAKIHTNKIITLKKRAVRIIVGSTFTLHTEPLFKFSILNLAELYKLILGIYMYKQVTNSVHNH